MRKFNNKRKYLPIFLFSALALLWFCSFALAQKETGNRKSPPPPGMVLKEKPSITVIPGAKTGKVKQRNVKKVKAIPASNAEQPRQGKATITESVPKAKVKQLKQGKATITQSVSKAKAKQLGQRKVPKGRVLPGSKAGPARVRPTRSKKSPRVIEMAPAPREELNIYQVPFPLPTNQPTQFLKPNKKWPGRKREESLN